MVEKIQKIHKDFLMQNKLLDATREAEKLLRDIGFEGEVEIDEYGGRTELFFDRQRSESVMKWSVGRSEYSVYYEATVRQDNGREYTGDGICPDAPLAIKSFYTALAREGFYAKYDYEKQYDHDRVKLTQYAVVSLENEPFRLEIKSEWYEDLDDC